MSDLVALSLYKNPANKLILLSWNCDDWQEFDIEGLSKPERLRLRHALTDIQKVYLCADAKATLKLLMPLGLDIARPMCFATLYELCIAEANRPPPMRHIFTSRDDALELAKQLFDMLPTVIDAVESRHLKKVARLECLMTRTFAALESRGLFIDVPAWKTVVDDCRSELEQLRSALPAEADNPDKLKAILEKELQISLPNTSHETLGQYQHPLAVQVVRYRELCKLVQAFGDGFLAHADPKTHRIHATFVSLGTSTGRASCHSPNLQNLPQDPRFRRCICAPEGRVLVSADYAGFELRILAGLAQDQKLIDIFAANRDLHAEVATQLFGVPVDKTNKPHLRDKAKTINFGLIYGMGPSTLAARLEISNHDAQALLDSYFLAFPQVKTFLDQCVDSALTLGYTQTALGRRLYFTPSDLSGDNRYRTARVAKNMPIQGTGADIVKLAMLRIHARLEAELSAAFLVNMIHDELIIECRIDDGDAVSKIVCEEMIGAFNTVIPNVMPAVDTSTGRYWTH